MASMSLTKAVIKQLEQCGAEVTNVGSRKEPLFSVSLEQGSLAHEKYIAHCAKCDDMDWSEVPDPLIHLMLPRAGVIPRQDDLLQVLQEANSVVEAYAPLRAADFVHGAPLPGLGPPVVLHCLGVEYHHSTISAQKVVERISSGLGCPVITTQSAGVVLCSIVYTYANARVGMPIVRM